MTSGGRRSVLPELGIAAALILCCALPLLLATGLMATLVGLVMRWWVIAGVASAVLAATLAAWLRRRRRRAACCDQPWDGAGP